MNFGNKQLNKNWLMGASKTWFEGLFSAAQYNQVHANVRINSHTPKNNLLSVQFTFQDDLNPQFKV